MGRILAIDHGLRRIGLALSDPMRIISSPFKTIIVENEDDAFDQLEEIVKTKEVDSIVMGLPIRTDGKDSPQTEIVRQFRDKLQVRLNKKVHFVDEAYSSTEAHRILKTMGKKYGDDKGAIDRIAASIILEQYMKEISPY